MIVVDEVATPEEGPFEDFAISRDFSLSPHVSAARNSISAFLAVQLTGIWSVTSSTRDVELSSSACGAFKGRCVIPQSISLSALKAFLSDHRTRHIVDDKLEEVQLLEVVSNTSNELINLQYLGYKRMFLVSGREFLICTSVRDIGESSFVIVSTSVDDSRYSENRKGRVRATLNIGGYLAKQVACGIELTMINKVSLGGKLPEMLTVPVQRQKPAEFLQKIKVQLSRLNL